MADNAQDFKTVVPPGTEAKIRSIFDFTAEALEELAAWIEQRGLKTPISQVLGFTQFAAQYSATQDATVESTTSTTYVNLTTTGPSITGLPDGQYLFIYGSVMKSDAAGNAARMSIDVNGAGAADNDCAETLQTQYTSAMAFATKTLSAGGNNTVTAKYRASAGTASFYRRHLVAFRYANK